MDDNLELSLNGERFLSTRENTTLFTFFGELALYNHVFLELSEPDAETASGAYIFSDHDAYKGIMSFIAQHDFPMVLNRTDVPVCDLDAWAQNHIQDLQDNDSFPEDWNNHA